MSQLKNLSVLVVNTNENMAHILRTALRAYGLGRVDEVHSLHEARNPFQRYPYDIVLTDVVVGRESGFDLVRWLRGEGDESGGTMTPVIVASASCELRTVLTSVHTGADEFITLPLSPKSLFKRIEKLIFHPHRYIRAPGYFGPDRRRRQDPSYAGPERRGVFVLD